MQQAVVLDQSQLLEKQINELFERALNEDTLAQVTLIDYFRSSFPLTPTGLKETQLRNFLLRCNQQSANPFAKAILGSFYQFGLGVQQNLKSAEECYAQSRKCSSTAYFAALLAIDTHNQNSNSIVEHAVETLRQESAQNNPLCDFLWGYYYRTLTPDKPEQALLHLEAASNKGFHQARSCAIEIYLNCKNHLPAIDHLKKYISESTYIIFTEAFYYLGKFCEINDDMISAIKYYSIGRIFKSKNAIAEFEELKKNDELYTLATHTAGAIAIIQTLNKNKILTFTDFSRKLAGELVKDKDPKTKAHYEEELKELSGHTPEMDGLLHQRMHAGVAPPVDPNDEKEINRKVNLKKGPGCFVM